MFREFESEFEEYLITENTLIEMKSIPFKYKELLLEYGGKSFDRGLYTIHTFKDSLKWTDLLTHYFEKYDGEVICFAHDWMGRQFCVPTKSNECIIVFDPATLEDLFLGENLINFHNNILTDKIGFLAVDLFDNALKQLRITGIDNDKCLGFKIPLFLGGKEEVWNYEVSDLEVYWDLEFQLYNQVKNMPDGTLIGKVSVDPISKKENK